MNGLVVGYDVIDEKRWINIVYNKRSLNYIYHILSLSFVTVSD